MLQTIREHTQGWIAGTVISIIILTFALWGIHSYFIGGNANPDVATVNGVSITKMQFGMLYDQLKRQIQNQFGTNQLAGREDVLRKSALRTAIDMEVLKQAALAENFRISDKQIMQYLQSIPEIQAGTQISGQQFDALYNNLLISQPRIGILATSFALPGEINNIIALLNQHRDFDYLTITPDLFAAQPINITPDKIQAYYNSHKAEFMTPDQVAIEYVELTLNDVAASIKPTDEALRNFYNDNMSTYALPMQWQLQNIEIPVSPTASSDEVQKASDKANSIYQAVMKGEDFAKAGQGNMGTLSSHEWVTLNTIPPEFQQAVADLKQAGDVTQPFRTSKGFEIIRAVAVQPSKTQSFETVKNKVRQSYVRQQAENQLATMRDHLADLTYEHPDSLRSAAKELNLTIKTTGLFTRDKGANDISQNKNIREVAFSQDVLQGQNNSDVIQLDPETVVVIRDKTYVPAKLIPLEEAKAKITTILQEQEAQQRAESLAQQVLQKLDAGSDPQQIATQNKLNWNKAGLSGRFDNKVDAAITETAFRLPDPANNKNKVSYGLARLPEGFAIVRLNSVKPGSLDEGKPYNVFAEQIQNSEGSLEYTLYKRSLINSANITVNQNQ